MCHYQRPPDYPLRRAPKITRSAPRPPRHHVPAAPLPGPLHQPPNRSGSPSGRLQFLQPQEGPRNPRHTTPPPNADTSAPRLPFHASPPTPAPKFTSKRKPRAADRDHRASSRGAYFVQVQESLPEAALRDVTPRDSPKLETSLGPRWPQAGMAPWPSGRWPHMASRRREGTGSRTPGGTLPH